MIEVDSIAVAVIKTEMNGEREDGIIERRKA